MTVRELIEAYAGSFERLAIYKNSDIEENLLCKKSFIVLPREYWNKKVKSFYKDLPLDNKGHIEEIFVIVIKE